MKYFILLMALSLFLFSKTVNCMVPRNIVKKVKPLFEDTIPYNQLQVKVRTSLDDKEALKQLVHNKKAKFAIIRRDVLWQAQESKSPFKNSYILISELPFMAMLYLVQSADGFDVDLDALEKREVSIGSLGELNQLYLKSLLNTYRLKNSVLYKSLSYKESIQQITKGKIDAYFGFLLPYKELSDLHFQTLFSEQTVAYFQNMHIFNIDYNGIASPYLLVASTTADDEEIESIIYRLMKKEWFVPITDERFGTINRYVLNHLEQVQKALKISYESKQHEKLQQDHRSKVCRQYHYGFLKLLRQKPAWKKQVKRLFNPEKSQALIKAFNKILLEIDEKKDICDLTFLKAQKIKLNTLKKIGH